MSKQEQEQYPEGSEIPDEVVNGWFEEDMNEAVGGVDRLLEQHKVDVPEAVYDVLVNMSFNLGQERLSKFTDMWRALEIGDYEAAAAEMKDSDWFGEVGNRAVRLIDRMLSVPSARPKEAELDLNAQAKVQGVDLSKFADGTYEDANGNVVTIKDGRVQ